MLLKIGRILLRLFLWGLLLLIVVLLVFDRVVQFRSDDKDVRTWLDSQHVKGHIAYYKAGGRTVRYVGVGDNQQATVLFVHGAPSSLTYWKGYLSDSTLLSRATMYAVDRPGYGYSGFGDPLANIRQQAAIIKPILDSLNKIHHPVIIVGASYGSPIATRIAMDYPDLVDGLVLVAPPLGPGLERYFWFTYLVESPVIHWVVPRMLQSANREKVHHRQDLDEMLPLWPRIRVPVKYLQGEKDELVFTSNAAFAREHLVNAPSFEVQMIPGKGHLIAFSEKERISNAILDMLDLCERRNAPH